MARFFNTAGPCSPNKHYMLPATERLGNVHELIAAESYFVVHAPRQTGKTTSLRALARELTQRGTYAALHFSCEAGEPWGDDQLRAQQAVLQSLQQSARHDLPAELWPPEQQPGQPETALSGFIGAWAPSCPRPLVLLMDEVDALRGDSLRAVLRQLRAGYPLRPESFAHSVVLCGLRDVRDYKAASGGDPGRLGTSSPFNVKVESLRLGNFSAEEVAALYRQHTEETGQVFSEQALETAFELSRGQPWLCNALAREVTVKMGVPVGEVIERVHLLEAKERLIAERATHLDSLVARLREDRVRRVIEPVLIGEASFDATFDDDFSYVRDLGLVDRDEDGAVSIANPIYAEIIPRVLGLQVQMALHQKTVWYVRGDSTLDLRKLLEAFIEFWRRHGEVLLRGMPYHEAAPHLVLMAFLQRIVNGGGRIEREFAIGTGRADLVVEFGGQRDIVELKLLRGSYSQPEGVEQVARYAARLGRTVGYLVLFDRQSARPWEERGTFETLDHLGVSVTVLTA